MVSKKRNITVFTDYQILCPWLNKTYLQNIETEGNMKYNKNNNHKAKRK